MSLTRPLSDKTRIVVVGSGGRLGAALLREYSQTSEVVGFNHAALDIADASAVRDALAPLGFDVLINCAAQTNVDRCETHREEAFNLNAEAPRVLAELARSKRAKLVHISTDYVFDGNKDQPYGEADSANPISVYGESKLAGEKFVLQTDPSHLMVRVSWVFGPDRPSFIDGVVKNAREKDRVNAVADKFSTPTYTLDLAAMLRRFLTDDTGGVLHLTNSGACSWQEYAQHALDCAHAAGIPLQARTVDALSLGEIRTFIARRPAYSVLSPAKYEAITGQKPRHWRDAVADYVRDWVTGRG